MTMKQNKYDAYITSAIIGIVMFFVGIWYGSLSVVVTSILISAIMVMLCVDMDTDRHK